MKYRQKENQVVVSVNSEPNPWVLRDQKRRDLVRAYLEQFKSVSESWKEAISGGWEVDLWRYVSAVAWVQAQMIVPGVTGIGFDGSIIFQNQNDAAIRRQFMNDQQRQANMGFIDVGIPTGMVSEWKSMAEYRKQLVSKQSSMMKKLSAPIEKSRLDLEIERRLTA